jgi:ribose transport system permease protein
MATSEATIERVAGGQSIGERLHRHAAAVGGVGVLIVIILVFSLLRPDTFPTADNFRQILDQTAVAAIMAAAVSVALVAGQYDLSVSAALALSGVVVADVVNAGMPWWIGVLAGCGVAVAIGLINGLVVTLIRVPSIVTTLGMQTVLLGVITWTTGDIYVSLNSPTMQNFANGTVLGIPTSALVMLAICGAGALFMRYAVPGRNLQAVGRNPAASRLAGINDGFYVVLALAITGLLVGLAAAVLTAQLGGGHPEVESGYLLPAFAAAFLGAAVSRTGTASFLGALYGALLLQCVTNGLVVVNAAPWSQNVVQGLILIMAVAVSMAARTRSVRA